jgi:predicted KAP-like P-loop ATPase
VRLASSQPKENPWQEDRLGYRPFAERLAKVIRALQAPNGYVIGLHGKWGSGKSTALNFVKAFLQKYNDETENEADRIHLVDFRPWIISGHQDLIAAFFKVLSESLGNKPGFSRHVARIGKVTADPLLDAFATVALVIDPTGGTATKAVTTVAKKSVGRAIDRFLAEPSLQAAYQKLRNELENSGKRFLVMIDDLDRLEHSEIRSIMQMVKTVGSLPNVVYLLAYDREIIWHVLDGESERVGPKFAEKIVQQELELPKPSKGSLLTILDEEIAFLNEQVSESMRWHYIVRDGEHRWIRHPRDVLRLSNGVKFSWPALQGEIDPADLLAMEGLRLFDPVAFDWVRGNRDFLFSEGIFLMPHENEEADLVEALKKSLPEESRQHVIKLLAVLFPLSVKTFEGKNAMGGENRAQVGRRRGVGSPAGYDAYFGLHPAADAIPKTVIDAIIKNMGDRAAVPKLIEPYLGQKDKAGKAVIGLLFEELRFQFYGDERTTPKPQFLHALFEIGDRVLRTESTPEPFFLSPQAHLRLLISEIHPRDLGGVSRRGHRVSPHSCEPGLD